ncbi:DUF3450 family protein [Aestuariibacter sp. A3R04]|uniref:DUF3450 family protein n=1 Tax=Aestuariibacter sp. A3R04 TaxID=2841571 RepID=UPI001C089865|nr:DUF3450 family protein [Aestuariibacter sp. A3R04]MBU3023957.1 DUF3450 domain-containing protein [Aestuariibacter sp. A3R04]
MLVQKCAVYSIPLITLSLAISVTSRVSAETRAKDIDGLTQQWIRIERQTQVLENEWREAEPALRQRIQLLKAERAQLQNIIDESRAATSDAEAQREALLSQQSELEAQQGGVERTLTRVIDRVDSLYSSLPEVLRESWDKEQAELTADADTSNKLQITLAKLSALQQFNSKLLVNEAVMRTPDGKDVFVKQFFVGSGYAWFTNADGQYQGVGNSLRGEWQWQFTDDMDSSAVSLAVAIFEKKHEPDYVSLPLTLFTGDNE